MTTSKQVPNKERRHFNYLASVYGTIEEASSSPLADGESLAKQCLDQLRAIENPEQFPPCLLILLASQAYLEKTKAQQLLAGVHKGFLDELHQEVPLIGSSVLGVIFDQKVHEQGALLICMASRVLDVRVNAGLDARNDPQGAIDSLLTGLRLNLEVPGTDKDLNPLGNRWLFTFFPGFGDGLASKEYIALQLHSRLRTRTMGRIGIVGGVSWANETLGMAGLQFAGKDVHVDAIVTALIESGIPFGIGVADGLTSTGDILRVRRLSDDEMTVEEFYEEGPPAEVLHRISSDILLVREMSVDPHPLVMRPQFQDDGSIRLRRPVNQHATFEIFKPDSEKVIDAAAETARQSLERMHIDNPNVYLIFVFADRYHAREEIGMEMEPAIYKVGEVLGKEVPCLGGLFNGEAGISLTSYSILANWSVTGVVFGDEMRERTLAYRGFAAMRKCVPSLLTARTREEIVELCLDLVFETGYPGAMLSLLFRDRPHDWIVAVGAHGERFKRIAKMTVRPMPEDDILAIVAREKSPIFVPDSRKDPRCDPDAINISGLVSMYNIPLITPDGDTFAVLQIDMGDVAYLGHPHEVEERVLKSIGEEVGAALTRFMEREELRITHALDEALAGPLAAESVERAVEEYTRAALDAMGATMGHVRLADRDRRHLRLVGGAGPYFEVAKKERGVIDAHDSSPTCRVFHEPQILIVNWADKDLDSIEMRERFEKGGRLREAIEGLKSYSNIPLRDEKGSAIGTISICADQPWFFTKWHARCLTDLGHHFEFLIEHITQRRKQEESRARLDFFLSVAPRMVKTANIKDVRSVLGGVTENLRRAANAEIASLYIWDNRIEKFVLRTQSGWVDPEWVDAAQYRRHQGWTGTAALEDRPRCEPDLRSHKKKTGQKTLGLYTTEIFGARLREGDTVEVIALPLRTADEQLGVLTLHRVKHRETVVIDSGFTTLDPRLLQNAADGFSALINTVFSHQRTIAENQEQRRLEDILKILVEQGSEEPLEKILCRQLMTTYYALTSRIYLTDKQHEPRFPDRAVEYRRANISAPGEEAVTPTPPDELVIRTGKSKQVNIVRVELQVGEEKDLVALKREGRITRVIIPMIIEGDRLLGLIDLEWGSEGRKDETWVMPQSNASFDVLGSAVASGLRRHHLFVEREEARKAAAQNERSAQVMGAMIFQMGHRLGNLLQDLAYAPDDIRSVATPEELGKLLADLDDQIDLGTKAIWRPREIVANAQQATRIAHPLQDLIESALAENDVDIRSKALAVAVSVPPDLHVLVHPDQMSEVFRNVVRNAVQAMSRGGTLRIHVSWAEHGKQIQVVFEDNGPGMTNEQIKAAYSGFVKTHTGMGVGVLIARLLTELNGGELQLIPRTGDGLQVIVKLEVQ